MRNAVSVDERRGIELFPSRFLGEQPGGDHLTQVAPVGQQLDHWTGLQDDHSSSSRTVRTALITWSLVSPESAPIWAMRSIVSAML